MFKSCIQLWRIVMPADRISDLSILQTINACLEDEKIWMKVLNWKNSNKNNIILEMFDLAPANGYLSASDLKNDLINGAISSNASNADVLSSAQCYNAGSNDSYPTPFQTQIDHLIKEAQANGCSYRYIIYEPTPNDEGGYDNYVDSLGSHTITLLCKIENGKPNFYYFDSRTDYNGLFSYFNRLLPNRFTLTNLSNMIIDDLNCGNYSKLFAYIFALKNLDKNTDENAAALAEVEKMLLKITGFEKDVFNDFISQNSPQDVFEHIVRGTTNIAEALSNATVDAAIEQTLKSPENARKLQEEIKNFTSFMCKHFDTSGNFGAVREQMVIASILATLTGLATRYFHVLPLCAMILVPLAPEYIDSLRKSHALRNASSNFQQSIESRLAATA